MGLVLFYSTICLYCLSVCVHVHLTLKVCSRRGFPDLSMRLSCRSVSSLSLRLSDLCQIVSWCMGSGSLEVGHGLCSGVGSGGQKGAIGVSPAPVHAGILIVRLRQLTVIWIWNGDWRYLLSHYNLVPKTKIVIVNIVVKVHLP